MVTKVYREGDVDLLSQVFFFFFGTIVLGKLLNQVLKERNCHQSTLHRIRTASSNHGYHMSLFFVVRQISVLTIILTFKRMKLKIWLKDDDSG